MTTQVKNHQGGKEFGKLLKQIELTCDEINQTFLEDEFWQDVEDLEDQLGSYKKQFIEYDADKSGDLNLMDVKIMMEKLGQAKTHLELKKMIAEVDISNSGTITYSEFLQMMLGKKSSVLKLILKFEEKMKGIEKPTGVPPKRDLSSLP
ncbi:hypothetical protein LOTGIDRAFT_216097 [Lottia gigantea]|uniref:EF-hand domain-containing protein n=1 Tax=Lottia gigantea TaxID=225164 RepID=V4ADQ8_LOTGI|nr:hypothetical protein LOTGIDRAFT_216097 [Lottia gigantea]ESO93260.1 hypothetical protein LOTGIDRAFT_216097 [Lottia gigantea]